MSRSKKSRQKKNPSDLIDNIIETENRIDLVPSSPNMLRGKETKKRRSQERDIPENAMKLENIKNHISLSFAILSIVLPPVKKYVKDKLKGYFKKIKTFQNTENQGQVLGCDPFKPKTKFVIKEHLTNHQELWKLYIDTKQYKFRDLDECDDISVFFTYYEQSWLLH